MDIMAMPSEMEGMSNALLESMACGVPTLCSGACGNAEVISHETDGILADLPDADALGKQLSRWLPDTEGLQRIGANARQTVSQKFSMATMAQRYDEVYQAIGGN
jgi:glycosyltransferase involved in cell wall biosynthesis